METEKKALLIKMSSEQHKRLKVATAVSGETMTAVILRLIEEYLREAEQKE